MCFQRLPRLSYFLFLAAALSAWAEPAAPAAPVLYFGRVFTVDWDAMDIRSVGSLSPAAPAAARDPAGRIWGRIGRSAFAALDPASGRTVFRIELPHTPYQHIITPSGRAYITHAAQTKEGFTVSIVDTQAGRLLGELTGIAGLRTDLVSAGGFVFLAVVEPLKPEAARVHLYGIDSGTDALRELFARPAAGRSLRLAASGSRLYVASVARLGSSAAAGLELWDADGRAARKGVDEAFWGRGRRLTGLFAEGGRVYLYLADAGGRFEIALADAELTSIAVRFPLSGPVSRILGRRGETLLYVDFPFEAGYRDVSLRFYDMGGRKEVKHIDLRTASGADRKK